MGVGRRPRHVHDYHVHSNYSDGRLLTSMVEAAAEAGLDGIGFADHCTVSAAEPMEAARRRLGFNLDRTYERRRGAIRELRGEVDLAIYDAVELDYHPDEEDRLREFLGEAGFDYALGSVHYVDGENVQVAAAFAGRSEGERRAVVEAYYDRLLALIGSGLFDVAAHVDLVERNPALRGLADPGTYATVADALADSDTIPELNAGRVHGEYGAFHPAPAFLDALLERGVPITVGTDSHFPDEIAERAASIEAELLDRDVEPTRVVPPETGRP